MVSRLRAIAADGFKQLLNDASIFRTLSREIPKCFAAARSLIPSRHAKRTLRYRSTV